MIAVERSPCVAMARAAVPDGALERARSLEPVTFGLPLPKAACFDVTAITVSLRHSKPTPTQARALDLWPDGSVRWVLVDAQLDTPGELAVTIGERAPQPAMPLHVAADDVKVTIDTGTLRAVVACGSDVLAVWEATHPGPPRIVTARFLDEHGNDVPVRLYAVHVEEQGPLRARIAAEGTVGPAADPLLQLSVSVHFYAGSSAVRIETAIRNERAASHRDGYWELGDPGSVMFRDFSLVVQHRDRDVQVCCRPFAGGPVGAGQHLSLHQDSSGGPNWRSENHVNRSGRVPLRFKGFQLACDAEQREGLRAQPVVWTRGGDGAPRLAVTVQEFWENFPKAIDAGEERVTVGLFPMPSADLHELQGGEQKTHVVGIDFAPPPSAPARIDWVAHPAIVACVPEWYSACAAVPYLIPATEDPHRTYVDLVNAALDGPNAFAAKRELVDEYGWRNFGDLYADHEAVDCDGPIVSHYNNQYDAVAGFAIQFMRTADTRWWTAMRQLASHVIDIDIYHTTADKPAYNGGLFWHTYHYRNAGRSTHRSFPCADGVVGGGPSAEHDYSTGLLLHYLLTGHEPSRLAVVSLADWLLAMEDGSRSAFRHWSRADTGHASATGSDSYHGPGRGAGNSIVTLLNAYRLTRAPRYLAKAEALIRRAVHPNDDIAARDLGNMELRWSYTVFLQALGRYLDDKAAAAELDWGYAYAQSSLLHYARWMARNEYPALEKPEKLEYPTETWAAQDMRKCEVFDVASRHTTGEERHLFCERASFFFDVSLTWLALLPTRALTRPLVLLLSNGYAHAAFRMPSHVAPLPTAMPGYVFGRPASFVPQKTIAIRRMAYVAGTLAIAAATGFGWALWAWLA